MLVGVRCRLSGKVRHANEQAATAALEHLLAREQKTGRVSLMHTYQCPHCGCWHIGHIPGSGVFMERLRATERERDHWRANHDEQVRKKQRQHARLVALVRALQRELAEERAHRC